MKSQTKTRLDWKEFVGNLGLIVGIMGILVLWDPLNLMPALAARMTVGPASFRSPEAAATAYGLILLVLGLMGLWFARPAWLQNRLQRAIRFVLEAWAELKKVQWPSWSEVWTFTIVVLIAIIAVALYIGLWDWFFTQLLHFLFA